MSAGIPKELSLHTMRQMGCRSGTAEPGANPRLAPSRSGSWLQTTCCSQAAHPLRNWLWPCPKT